MFSLYSAPNRLVDRACVVITGDLLIRLTRYVQKNSDPTYPREGGLLARWGRRTLAGLLGWLVWLCWLIGLLRFVGLGRLVVTNPVFRRRRRLACVEDEKGTNLHV